MSYLSLTDADRDAKMVSLRPYLAEDLEADDDDLDEEDERDDADVFVETKTHRFLATLGLPPLGASG